jgi:hypothetical protein
MSTSHLGCAQNPDGSLRDASEIQFYNDADDEHPISGPNSTRPIHGFFTGATQPVGKVAGARRSGRESRPSARIKDPNNAESSTRSVKRKPSNEHPTARKVARRAPAAASEESDGTDSETEPTNNADTSTTAGDTEGEDGEGQEVMDREEYESMKVMADADHAQVCTLHAIPFFFCYLLS